MKESASDEQEARPRGSNFTVKSDVKAEACANFTVDITAEGFGVCICGNKKSEHSTSVSARGYSGHRRSSSSSSSTKKKKKTKKKKCARTGRVISMTYPANALQDYEAARASKAAMESKEKLATRTETPTPARSRASPSVESAAAAIVQRSSSIEEIDSDATPRTTAEATERLLTLLDAAGKSEWSPSGGALYALLPAATQAALSRTIASAQEHAPAAAPPPPTPEGGAAAVGVAEEPELRSPLARAAKAAVEVEEFELNLRSPLARAAKAEVEVEEFQLNLRSPLARAAKAAVEVEEFQLNSPRPNGGCTVSGGRDSAIDMSGDGGLFATPGEGRLFAKGASRGGGGGLFDSSDTDSDI